MFGAALGPFRVNGRIDQGGMGQVWQGEHVRSGLPVAVKLVREDKPEFTAAFFEEVRAIARLDHPHVIAVLDCGRVEAHAVAASKGALRLGAPWFAMEYCGGGQLSASSPTDWAGLRTCVQEILRALAYAHARGVLHRDLTPENVLLAGPDDVRPGLKLTDFGLGPALCASMPSGTVVGTPAYMAPEQFSREGGLHGPWTDLYALGCLAWSLATGAPPFGRDRPAGVLALAHQELELPPFVPRFSVPRGFDAWLAHCLEKDAARRFRHSSEAAAALVALDGAVAPRGLPLRWRTDEATPRPFRLVDAGLGLWSLRPAPFVGRIRERDQLWDALGGVERQGTARLIHLTGPTGSGRTRLASWLAERACESAGCGAVVVRAGDSLDHAQRRVRATFREPLVLVLDDAHADVNLLSLAGVVLRQRAGSPILIVLTTRSDALAAAPDAARDVDALMAMPVASRMELGPLTPADEYAFLKHGLGLGTGLCERVRERVAGNPAYAVILVGEAVRTRTLVAGTDGLDVPLGEALAMPADARAHWNTEVERTLAAVGARPDGTSRIALEAAAVLGMTVDEGEWNAVCQRLGIRPPTALVERLIRERFAVLARRTDGKTEPGDALSWTFAHGQLRDALVAGAEEAERLQLLNRTCAAILSAGRRGQPGVTERIGRHLYDAGDFGEAVGWLVRGAKKSLVREDLRPATTLLGLAERAAERANVDPGDERLGLVRTLRAVVRIREGDRAAGQKEIERVLELAPANGWRAALAEALLARADLHRRAGHPDAAMQLLGSVRSLALELGDDTMAGRATLVLAQLAVEMGECGRAAALSDQAAESARRASDHRLLSEALAMAGEAARRQGDLVRAAFCAKEALAVATAIPHKAAMGAARGVLAEVERAEGRFDKAAAGHQSALAALEEIGAPEAVVPVVRLAAMLLGQGRVPDAGRLLVAGRREAQRHGLRGWRAAIDAIGASGAVLRGQFEGVSMLLDGASALAGSEFHDPDAAAALEAVGVALFPLKDPSKQAMGLRALDLARTQYVGLQNEAGVARVDAVRASSK